MNLDFGKAKFNNNRKNLWIIASVLLFVGFSSGYVSPVKVA